MYGRCINGNTSGRHRVLRSLNNGMFKLKYASKTHDEKKRKILSIIFRKNNK